MMKIVDRQTAEIIPFPAGGRAGLDRMQAAGLGFADLAETAADMVTPVTSWYHDEAVREAQQPILKQ